MNKLQIHGSIKDVAGMAQEAFGKLVGSADQQARGFKLKSAGWEMIALGDVEELAKAVLYDKEFAKRRDVWVNGGG